MGLCLTALSAVTLAPGPAQAAGPEELQERGGYTAKIRRTEYGVPHIQAHDFGGLGYGYGYAFAQDNLCQLADHVVTLRGERSRYFGPAEASADDPHVANLASDTYFQGLNRSGTVQRLLEQPAPLGPTPELRRMVEGYAAGYNRYLRDTGVGKLPDPTCRGEEWVGPISATDLWTLMLDLNTAAGASAYKGPIGSAAPPGAAATTAAAAGASPAPRPARPAGEAADLGSNGWALGRDATRDGHGMLLANPHLKWAGSDRFYQVHLTVPGVLDVAGGSIYGTPMVEIGHSRDLAWTHTTSYADHASLYRLALAPGDPTGYLVDGRPEPMGRQSVPVTVRAADGTLSTVTATLYTSRYGPVLADGWSAEHAYTLRDANAGNLRSMNEWLAMGRARTLDQLKQAQRTYQGIPWTYTIATDAGGTAYFTDSSAVPHLTDEQRTGCTVEADELGTTLDGSTTACDWGSDPDALVPGVHGPARQPALTRTDYVANSNNGPYYTNADAPLTGIPAVYNGGSRLGPRAQLGLRMIDDRRTGADGLGGRGFTLPTLQATMLGDRVYTAELGRGDAVAMCRAHPVPTATDGTAVDVRAACDVLAAWDARADADSRGTVLWQAFQQALGRSGPPTWWRVPYDPAQPLTTPRGIDGENPAARRALADAVQWLSARGTPPDAPIGLVQRWAGIPLPGCSGGLGCFNVLTAGPQSGAGGATRPADLTTIPHGSGFMMAVEMTPRGPRSRTLLTYGESADPGSPHYTDQTRLFARKEWVTERFTEAEIKAAPGLLVTTLVR
ncbi:penicillin acylase family protein [Kitasatospora sp. CM 4170]|uniref:penicillin acylase family protein n=1 Tax=Kitasatospora sp. CM 4170 TaxID=3075627 RepID=UPI0028AE62D9|nr:penicillin acylase family protein [Kitasatospora sp. CM 4170]WNM44103.1 penicillin acylase family protein [Kitasatospora sp. CM 4170]